MKNRKAPHRAQDLATLAKSAVAAAKERRAVALEEAELTAATGGVLPGGLLTGAILEPDTTI